MSDQITYGGQAVIEGVMMRGPRFFAVACRKPDGEILVQSEEVPAFFTRYAWAKWPFLRGVFALADSLVLGMKSLMWSANLAVTEEQKRQEVPPPDPFTQALLGPLWLVLGVDGGAPSPGANGTGPGSGTINNVTVTSAAFIGMAFGIALFFLVPALIGKLAGHWVGATVWQPIIEAIVRIAMVLGYLWAIGRMAHVQRLFQYHGAEHQAINAWEKEGAVDVEAASRASRIHPRCGTNFVLTVLLVKGILFAFVPVQKSLLVTLGLRLGLLPVVAALSYEVIRLAGKYRESALLQWMVAPGLFTQYLTTRVPGREMVEVAVASLRGVMEREGVLHSPESNPTAVV